MERKAEDFPEKPKGSALIGRSPFGTEKLGDALRDKNRHLHVTDRARIRTQRDFHVADRTGIRTLRDFHVTSFDNYLTSTAIH